MLGPLIAAGQLPLLVQDLAISLTAAVLFAVVCGRLRLAHVLGFIAAGVAVGPSGMQMVSSPDDVKVIAELGIILLLFLIGVELDVAAMRQRGRVIALVGGLQVPLTVLLGLGLGYAVGLVLGWPPDAAELLYFGLAAAFSSTLLVVGALESRDVVRTLFGALCIGLLLAQDIWALVVLAIQPAGELSARAILSPLAGTAVLGALIVGLGRIVVRRVVGWFDGTPEFLGLLAIGWCMGCALFAAGLEGFTHDMGPVALSSGAGMGAFAAGVTVAAVPQAHELAHRLVGLRDFFILFFFVSLGMSIPWPITAAEVLEAVILVAVVGIVRAAVMYPLLRAAGTETPMATAVTAQMGQVSEFGLVILYLGYELGHVSSSLVTVVVLAFVITSALTPRLGRFANVRLAGQATRAPDESEVRSA